VFDVNRLINNFEQMKKMMKKMGQGGKPGRGVSASPPREDVIYNSLQRIAMRYITKKSGGTVVSVKIRLTRMGTIKKPFYRIVADRFQGQTGREYLGKPRGIYHPLRNKGTRRHGRNRHQRGKGQIPRLKNGAKPSHTVSNCFSTRRDI